MFPLFVPRRRADILLCRTFSQNPVFGIVAEVGVYFREFLPEEGKGPVFYEYAAFGNCAYRKHGSMEQTEDAETLSEEKESENVDGTSESTNFGMPEKS